jgi:hypothetical protein
MDDGGDEIVAIADEDFTPSLGDESSLGDE